VATSQRPIPLCPENRLPLPELLFLPSSLDDLVELRRSLAAAGYSRAKVAGCIEFVMGRAEGDGRTDSASAAEYRRMLAGLLASVGPEKGAYLSSRGQAAA
jgi:hypothetical protein